MVAPFLETTKAPQMIVHARFLFGRTSESAVLAAAAKVDLMPLEVIAEHSA